MQVTPGVSPHLDPVARIVATRSVFFLAEGAPPMIYRGVSTKYSTATAMGTQRTSAAPGGGAPMARTFRRGLPQATSLSELRPRRYTQL